MVNLEDTQPNRAILDDGYDTLPAPPRFLLWGVIGLFLLGILGTLVGIYVFREVLEPRYQQSVITRLPFMEAFLPAHSGSDTLPTAGPVDDADVNALLFGSGSSGAAETTPESTPEPLATATATQAPSPTPSPEPTTPPTEQAAVPTEAPTAAPMPTFTPQPPAVEAAPGLAVSRPVSHINYGFVWDRQDWNNCGPTTVTTALSFFGWTRDQGYAADYLRPNPEDKNVSPHELVAFVNEQTDVNALHRIGGDLDLLRTLVANEFPVIIEVGGNLFEAYEWIGHYLNVTGYDDDQGIFYVVDSFLGAGEGGFGRIEPYNSLDETWRAFNRHYVVLYEPWREEQLMALLGEHADPWAAAEHAFEVAQADARANRDDAFAWFNMGTALTRLGRYEEAAAAFDQATRAGMPWRTLWYQFEPFEAYFNTGDYESVLIYVENNLNNGGFYVEETHYWQGRVYEAQGRTAQARSAYRTALQRNRNFEAARTALERLG